MHRLLRSIPNKRERDALLYGKEQGAAHLSFPSQKKSLLILKTKNMKIDCLIPLMQSMGWIPLIASSSLEVYMIRRLVPKNLVYVKIFLV